MDKLKPYLFHQTKYLSVGNKKNLQNVATLPLLSNSVGSTFQFLKTPFQSLAVGLGRLDMLRVLSGHGANLTAVDLQGDNAVYWAARQGHSGVIQYLVEQGVRVDQQNKVRQYLSW